MKKARQFIAFLTLFGVAACSGGGSRAILPQASSATKATALVKVVWPIKPLSTRRHPMYVSPSTMSVVVEVTGPDGSVSTTIANNTGKTSSTSISLLAPVGNDKFIVSLYDQPQIVGEATAVGNALGQAMVTQTITAGAANNVNFTVDGIVSLVSVAIASPSPYATVSGAPGSQTVTVIGDAPQLITLTPLDADGNAIVAPGNLPRYSLTSSASTGHRLSIAASATNANQYTLTPVAPGVTGNGAQDVFTPVRSLQLIATATDDLGPHTTNVVVSPVSEIFVSYQAGAGSKIAAFDGAGNPLPLASGAFGGITNPVGIAYDPDDHWLFVADSSNKILAFDTLGNPIGGFVAPTWLSGITAIGYYSDSVGRASTTGLSSNPHRLLVADSHGIIELSTAGVYLARGSGLNSSGGQISASAIAGVVNDGGPSTSGALIVLVDPATKTVNDYDMANPDSNTGLPLPPPTYFSTTTPNGETPAGIAVVGFFENPSCHPSASPSTGVLVATGAANNLDVYTAQCGAGVYSGFTGPFSSNSTPLGANISALAIDYVNGGIYGVETAQNAIVDFSLQGLGTGPAPSQLSAGSFATPSSTGLSNPNAIAIAF